MLSRALKKVNLPPEERGYEENLLQENLKFGYQEYYKIKGNSKELRQTALENLAKAITSSGNVTQEKAFKALRDREAQRHKERKIRYLRGKIHTAAREW